MAELIPCLEGEIKELKKEGVKVGYEMVAVK